MPPFSLVKIRYSQLVAHKTDGKWRRELDKSIQDSSEDFAKAAKEYVVELERFELEQGETPALQTTKQFFYENSDITFNNPVLQRLTEALFGSPPDVKGAIHKYGDLSPVGVIIDQLRSIGLFPLKNRLTESFLK